MPISPERAKLYPKDWPAISLAVRTEAAWCCEWCGRAESEPTAAAKRARPGSKASKARVVLTVAHLDQDPTNNARDNLAALCQACHLGHDAHQHAANRAAIRSPLTRDLFLPRAAAERASRQNSPVGRPYRFAWVLCCMTWPDGTDEVVWRPGVWLSTVERGPHEGRARVRVFWRSRRSGVRVIPADDLEPRCTLTPPPMRMPVAAWEELPPSP